MRKDKRIVRAAAGNDKLVDFVFAENEAVERVDHGKSRENRGGPDEIGRPGVMAAAKGENFLDISAAIVFAAGGFRRRELQIRVFHQFIEKSRDCAAGLREAGVFVEALSPMGEALDQRVNEHVGGASVEGKNLRRFRVGRNHGDVGDAA